jgi:D-sedoheptulose 7-phosphate isomerase
MSVALDPERFSTTSYLADSIAALTAFSRDARALDVLAGMAGVICNALRQGGKLLVAGNGGSAGDAQHIAGEFVSRLMYDRAPLACVALTTDSSGMTAIGNDYGFEHVFARQLRALGRPGDVFLGISTSGNSPNLLTAFADARAGGIHTIGFTGNREGKMNALCDLVLQAPSSHTPVIQQIHIVAAHILCAEVETTLCPRAPSR